MEMTDADMARLLTLQPHLGNKKPPRVVVLVCKDQIGAEKYHAARLDNDLLTRCGQSATLGGERCNWRVDGFWRPGDDDRRITCPSCRRILKLPKLTGYQC